MKTILAILLFAFALQAAEVQIVVRNDGGDILVDTTIMTSMEVLAALESWRLKQTTTDENGDEALKYPTREAFFRAIMIDVAKRIIRQQPTPAMQAERDAQQAAKQNEEALVESAMQ